jgi:hypothetical protein
MISWITTFARRLTVQTGTGAEWHIEESPHAHGTLGERAEKGLRKGPLKLGVRGSLRDLLEHGADSLLGMSIITCREAAKLVEYGRLKLDCEVRPWIESALAGLGVSQCTAIPRKPPN